MLDKTKAAIMAEIAMSKVSVDPALIPVAHTINVLKALEEDLMGKKKDEDNY